MSFIKICVSFSLHRLLEQGKHKEENKTDNTKGEEEEEDEKEKEEKRRKRREEKEEKGEEKEEKREREEKKGEKEEKEKKYFYLERKKRLKKSSCMTIKIFEKKQLKQKQADRSF